MKTHIPATLRKALIAALFAVSAAAYNAQAAPVDIVNSSEGYAETGGLGYKKTSTGYADLIFSGTNEILGTVDHWCHDGDTLSVEHRRGDDTYITLDPGASGKYVAHSIAANRGKDDNSTIVSPYHDCSDWDVEFGYSKSWSNGNINVQNETVLEVTASITANGAININGASRVTAGNKVTAGEINLTGASLTAGVVSGSRNELWVPGGDSVDSSGNINVTNGAVLDATNIDTRTTITVSGASSVTASGKVAGGEIIVTNSSVTAGDITVSKNTIRVLGGDSYDTTGKMTITGSDAVVTATGIVSAAGGVDVSDRAHLNASNIDATVGGSTGYVRALPGENLKVTKVASEKTQYIVDNGCTITLGGIGVYDEENKEMHGNGNYFGYGEDSNNIKADAIYVMGNIISDDNELAALGGSVDNRLVDSNYNAILVKGAITGNGNKLFVREQDSAGIWVNQNVSGDNNVLETKTSGDIHIAGMLGRSGETGPAVGNNVCATKGDISIGFLANNVNLAIHAMDGEVEIKEASEATIRDSSITASDDVVIAADETGSTKVLTLVGGSVESDTGDIVSNQVIRANGTALTAEEGDINVYRLTYDSDNANYTGIQVTAQNLIAGRDLELDGTKTGSFNSFVTVEEDMRTTWNSISITNFTDKDTVKVGHDIDSAASITIKNVNGMLVGTEGEDGIEYEGSMTAKRDISITDSIVDILGSQESTERDISIIKDGSDTRVAIDGDQKAAKISTRGATLRVGILVEEEGADGKPVYSVEGGKQVANVSINIGAASIVEVLDSQEAKSGSITITGSTVTVGAKNTDGEIVQKGNQTAGADIFIEDSTVTVLGSETARMDITVTDSAVNVGGSQTSTVGSIVIQSTEKPEATPSVVTVAGDQLAAERIKVADGSTLTVGTLDTDAKTGVVTLSGGNQQADGEEGININAATANVLGNQTATHGAIDIKHGSQVTVGSLNEKGEVLGGNQTANTDIMVTDDSQLSVLGDQTSQEGNIVINDASVVVNGKVVALGNGTDGTGIVTLEGATYAVGTSLEAKELTIDTTMDNTSDVTINLESLDTDGETPLATVLDVDKLAVADGNTLHTGTVKMDAADVTIKGIVEAGVKDYEDPTNDIAADWKVTGSHDISGADAHLMANGDIEIVATEEGDAIRIADDAKVSATGNVTIQGLAARLAEVDNATVHATGDIIFDRAELTNNHDTDIATKGGDIVLKNRVEISDTMLNVLPTEEGKEGVINVAEGADVQLYQGTVDVFNGALAGTGSVTANDENLVISHDSPGFNGRINMVRDNEQTLYIGSKGVGDKAVLSMQKGSSLATRIGGQDANLGNVVTTDGSFIQMNAVDKGNRTTATSLNLTAGTTYELFATTDDTTGALLADTITVSNGINANGARVRAHSDTPLESLADGSRFTIAGGSVVSGFNEDVLYDMVQPDAGSKRTARALQTRNMHLEHTAHGVDLVVSENYKAIDDRNTNAAAVRDVILPLDAAADHRPGKLAGSASQLDHVLDALDYTRSGADAREGLLSLSGAANLIVPNMMMDASRHHLSALRDHMSAPVCNKDRKTKGNVWAAYIGGYDHIGGDENMHAYSHSYQGALVGGDYAVNCNWAVGLSLGYQKSIAHTVGTRADADAISGDLYAVGRTGKYTHRFSMGLTSYSTDVKRGTRIAAAGHTYHGQSTGSADGMSWNFGYQLSRNFAINEVSSITPYLTVDVALQRIDTLNEKGQGDASVVTDYEDFVQTDAALGVAYSHTFTSFNRQAGVVSVNLAAHGEFSEHRATAKNHFAGYADTWKTRSMKRAPFYGELGADVVVPFGQHISGTAGVNFEFSADRTFVGGHAGVNYRF